MPYVVCLGYAPESYQITAMHGLQIELHKNNDGEVYFAAAKLDNIKEIVDHVHKFVLKQDEHDPNHESITYMPRRDGTPIIIVECGVE